MQIVGKIIDIKILFFTFKFSIVSCIYVFILSKPATTYSLDVFPNWGVAKFTKTPKAADSRPQQFTTIRHSSKFTTIRHSSKFTTISLVEVYNDSSLVEVYNDSIKFRTIVVEVYNNCHWSSQQLVASRSLRSSLRQEIAHHQVNVNSQ